MPGPGNVPATLLTITPLSGESSAYLTPYSARGLSQELVMTTSLSGGTSALGTRIRRDVNGNLLNLTYPQFRKYLSTITCKDIQTPAFDEAWEGEIVQVQCAALLSYLTAVGTPQRPIVSGSAWTEGDFTFYQPELTMMITAVKNRHEEWEAWYAWQLELAEI